MASLRLTTVFVSGLAVLASTGAAQAQAKLDPSRAALCAAAMQIASSGRGNSVTEQLDYQKAADWFYQDGVSGAGGSTTATLISEYRGTLEDARLNGDKSYGKAVSGCLTYYKTSANDVPDASITGRK